MVTTTQDREDSTEPYNCIIKQTLSTHFIKEKAKKGLGSPGEGSSESPGCWLWRACRAKYSLAWWKVLIVQVEYLIQKSKIEMLQNPKVLKAPT